MATTKQIILITGGNAGIGFEIAAQMIENANVHVLLGSRSLERGDSAIKTLESRKLSGSVELLQLDVADEESIKKAAVSVQVKHQRLDALVNNAGIVPSEGSLSEQMMLAFKTNAVSAELMGVYFAPLLKKSSDPRIVFITSGAGSIATRMDRNHPAAAMKVLPYRVSKAAMNMVFASQVYDYPEFKMFLYGPGPTKSTLSKANQAPGMKDTSEGARPAVEMLRGERDGEVEKYIEYGYEEAMPW